MTMPACLAVAAVAALLPAQPPPLKALVYEHQDQWTRSAQCAERLRAAGFDVAALPLDRSPAELDADLIALGSFVCEEPRYADYMRRFGKDLAAFAERGHLLLQFTQTDQNEKVPPFLPPSLGCQRADPDYGTVRARSPQHPLLRDVALRDGTLQYSRTRTAWEAFAEQGNFEVILGGGSNAEHPALLEAALGPGRLLLSSLAIDKQNDGEKDVDAALHERREAFARQFFANLAAHALAVREHRAPVPKPTPGTLPPVPFAPGSWTLAVLPDTQYYSQDWPGLFLMQTAWIAQHRDERDIRFVLGLGDIVNDNSEPQWRHAWAAVQLLHGKVPYALAAGNHDYGPGGNARTRDTGYDTFFPVEQVAAQPSFGGAMQPGKLDNTWHRFDAWNRKWIVLCLEWGPRDEVVQWADEVMQQNRGRLGILITHAYLDHDDRRFDHTNAQHPQGSSPHEYQTAGGVNDGEELWQKLVRKHDFVLVLNGHVCADGTGYLASSNDQGRTVHQILSNYQFRPLGGEGYLRLMEFRPDGHTVQVRTYSPLYDRYLTEPDQQFAFVID